MKGLWPSRRAAARSRRPLPADGSVRDSTFISLHIHNYRLYFVGQVISVAGNWMQNIAIGWVALQLAHSGVVLGLVTAARFAPLLVLGPWGGRAADRSNLRRLITMTQTCAAIVSFLMAVMSLIGLLNIAALFVLIIALGLVNVFDMPGRQSLISQLVDRERLANAIALNSIAMNAARVLGPAVAGLMIATLGVTSCFFANAVSFVAVIVSLLLMRAELIPTGRENRGKGQIIASLRHVRATPGLLWPLVMVTVTGVFTWEFPVSLPLMTTGAFHQGAAGYGVATSVLGIGSVCGGLFAARRRQRGRDGAAELDQRVEVLRDGP